MDLAGAIRRVPARGFTGTVHRIYDRDHGFLETIGSYLHGGRWNRKLQYGALYTALDFETAIAETRRGAEKRNLSLRDLGQRDYVKLRVRLGRVLDLTSTEFYDSLGVSKEAVLQDEALCLQIADQARELGFEALLAPSATGSGTNLVIYQEKLAPDWALEEVERRQNILSKQSEGRTARE